MKPPMPGCRSAKKESRIIQRYHELKTKICRMREEIKRKEKVAAIRKKVKSLCPSARPLIQDVDEDIQNDLKTNWNFPVLKLLGGILGTFIKV